MKCSPATAAVAAAPCVPAIMLVCPGCRRIAVQEFLRVGYYVNNEYLEDELRDNPPDVPLIDR